MSTDSIADADTIVRRTINRSEHGSLKVHTYVAPESSFLRNRGTHRHGCPH